MKKEKTYITATCPHCKEAYLRECSEKFFTETPSNTKVCDKCRKAGYKDRKKKTPEEIELFKQKMKEARERRKNEG